MYREIAQLYDYVYISGAYAHNPCLDNVIIFIGLETKMKNTESTFLRCSIPLKHLNSEMHLKSAHLKSEHK